MNNDCKMIAEAYEDIRFEEPPLRKPETSKIYIVKMTRDFTKTYGDTPWNDYDDEEGETDEALPPPATVKIIKEGKEARFERAHLREIDNIREVLNFLSKRYGGVWELDSEHLDEDGEPDVDAWTCYRTDPSRYSGKGWQYRVGTPEEELNAELDREEEYENESHLDDEPE